MLFWTQLYINYVDSHNCRLAQWVIEKANSIQGWIDNRFDYTDTFMVPKRLLIIITKKKIYTFVVMM